MERVGKKLTSKQGNACSPHWKPCAEQSLHKSGKGLLDARPRGRTCRSRPRPGACSYTQHVQAASPETSVGGKMHLTAGRPPATSLAKSSAHRSTPSASRSCPNSPAQSCTTEAMGNVKHHVAAVCRQTARKSVYLDTCMAVHVQRLPAARLQWCPPRQAPHFSAA